LIKRVAASRRKKPADYHKLAEKAGFRWLGPEVKNSAANTQWECSIGHVWPTPYTTIQGGHGCPHCAGMVPKTSTDYYALGEKMGLTWMGPEVPNIRTRTNWQCSAGHVWPARYGDISRGHGCPHCAGMARKTPEDYHALAKSRGFTWLGPEVQNNQTKTGWRCDKGHEWQGLYDSIQTGHGCLTCAGKAPKIKDDYHALADVRGFRWVGSKLPKNTMTKTTWECENGHHWRSHYNNISFGSGCPDCVDMVNGHFVSKQQRTICEMLNGELNERAGPYYIDVAFEAGDMRVALEYDAWYWHAHNAEYDTQRDTNLIEAGWRVLRVKSNKEVPTKEQLEAAIARLMAGEMQAEIELGDWGMGPTRFTQSTQ